MKKYYLFYLIFDRKQSSTWWELNRSGKVASDWVKQFQIIVFGNNNFNCKSSKRPVPYQSNWMSMSMMQTYLLQLSHSPCAGLTTPSAERVVSCYGAYRTSWHPQWLFSMLDRKLKKLSKLGFLLSLPSISRKFDQQPPSSTLPSYQRRLADSPLVGA